MNNVDITNIEPYRLITIPISHYSEKARWALDWLKIHYVEERHVPFFHRIATGLRGGKSVPVLVTKEQTFKDSTDILHFLDTKATGNQRLYPSDPDLRREVEDLEELFDTKLGVYIRSWAYSYVLDDREAIRQVWCAGTPRWEQRGFAIAFPLMRLIVKKLYNVNSSSAATCLQGIRRIFTTVSNRLSDGRPYLVGDRFSAADLTFAALTAPILLAPEHPLKPRKIEELHKEMAIVIRELKESPAGVYALRLYREERRTEQ